MLGVFAPKTFGAPCQYLCKVLGNKVVRLFCPVAITTAYWTCSAQKKLLPKCAKPSSRAIKGAMTEPKSLFSAVQLQRSNDVFDVPTSCCFERVFIEHSLSSRNFQTKLSKLFFLHTQAIHQD